MTEQAHELLDPTQAGISVPTPSRSVHAAPSVSTDANALARNTNSPSPTIRNPAPAPPSPSGSNPDDNGEDNNRNSDSNGSANNRNSDPNGTATVDQYPQFSRPREALLVLVLLYSQLITQAGITQGVFTINSIGETFGIRDISLSWTVSAYALTIGTFILCAGRLGDLFGHKRMYLVGCAWLVFGSLLAGISHYGDFIFFAVCRGLQGLGPAFLLPNGMAILEKSFAPGVRQAVILALYGASASTGAIMGALFSSLLAQLASWEWAYYLCAIVSALVGLLCFFVIPMDEMPDRKMSFDYWGTPLQVTGLVLFMVAWNQAPNVGWHTPYVYVFVIIAVLLLAAFFWVETKVSCPLVPISLLDRRVTLTLACIACGWGSFGIWVVYITQLLLNLRHQTLLLATAQITPLVVSGLIASVLTGFLLTRRIPVALMLTIALTAFLACSILLATMPVEQDYWAQTFVSFVLIPFGIDMSIPAAIFMVNTSIPHKHQGMAAALVTTVVNCSISVALGIAGTVVTATSPGQTLEALTTAMHNAALVGVGLSGLGVVGALVTTGFELFVKSASGV